MFSDPRLSKASLWTRNPQHLSVYGLSKEDYRRLGVRYEQHPDIHRALLTLGCSLNSGKRLTAL
jgi:hypothetical protein